MGSSKLISLQSQNKRSPTAEGPGRGGQVCGRQREGGLSLGAAADENERAEIKPGKGAARAECNKKGAHAQSRTKRRRWSLARATETVGVLRTAPSRRALAAAKTDRGAGALPGEGSRRARGRANPNARQVRDRGVSIARHGSHDQIAAVALLWERRKAEETRGDCEGGARRPRVRRSRGPRSTGLSGKTRVGLCAADRQYTCVSETT